MCCGTKERPEEEQFNKGALWQVQNSGQAGMVEVQWSQEETMSSTRAKKGTCATAMTAYPENTDRL